MKKQVKTSISSILCCVLISVLIFSSFDVTSYGQKKDETSIKPPMGLIKQEEVSKNEKSLYIKNVRQLQDITENNYELYRPPVLENKKDIDSLTAEASKKYTLGELASYNYDELVNLLVTLEWNDIEDLFKYNSGSNDFYIDKDRMQAIIDAVVDRGVQYTPNDDKGIPTLIEVLRSGYYLGFYHKELSYLKELSFRDKCIPAIVAIENNPNFGLGTPTQDKIAGSVGLLIWNTSCNAEVIDKATPVIKHYIDNVGAYINERSKGDAIYNLMRGIDYYLDYYLYVNNSIPIKETPWYGQIDLFIHELERLALMGNINNDNEWLINNGIYCIGRSGKFHSNERFMCRVLTDVLSLYPYLGKQYFEAAQGVTDNCDGVDYNGNTINMNEIKEEGKKKYTPSQYNFDNGKTIVRTGSRVTTEKIKRLYWASKEVKAQFHRLYGSDEPMEAGNPDDKLTIIIYNDPDEYKINKYLYGVSTDNGGLYIESWGTFFTYERTPSQSIYTLEELFRHEYTHYLQGRYVVPGMWGKSDIYKDERLSWYEEGGAEFFAGSTRTSGVLPRKSMVGGIAKEPSERFTLNQTLHSKYSSGFKFYTYAYAFIDYLYKNDLEAFDTLASLVKNNDASGFDSYISTLDGNSSLEKLYQEHMTDLSNNYDNLTTPLVSDDYLNDHPYKVPSEIYDEITNVANLKNTTVIEYESDFFKTFALRGKYIGKSTNGKLNDLKAMDDIANEFLKTLETYSWSGYDTVTCYFVNYNVNSEDKYEFDVLFQGLMPNNGITKESEPNNTIEEANGPVGNMVTLTGTVDYQSDNLDYYYFDVLSAGEVTITVTGDDKGDLNWKVYAASDLDTCVAYPNTSGDVLEKSFDADAGKYILAVYPLSGTTNSYTLNIKGDLQGYNKIAVETEPNDNIDSANAIYSSKKVMGSFKDEDVLDIFYFDSISSDEINVKVMVAGKGEINWVLYKESDPQTYLAYPKNSGDILEDSFNTLPGRYYINVYKISGPDTDYSIEIQETSN